MLIEYVWERKNGRRQKKGVLIGGKLENEDLICVGFSSCSPRDQFDRDFGNEVAIERALRFCERTPKKIPFSIQDKLPKFIHRCKRYFKSNNFPSWVKKYDLEAILEEINDQKNKNNYFNNLNSFHNTVPNSFSNRCNSKHIR